MSGKREDYISWDEHFMGIVYLSVLRSKDPNTQVGVCIVNDDNRTLSMGYNGFPRDYSDDEFPWEKERGQDDPYRAKCFYVTYSELNVILNYRGGSFEGSKFYVTLFPYNEYAKAITQSGIRTLIYGEGRYGDTATIRTSKCILNVAGVHYYQYIKTR